MEVLSSRFVRKNRGGTDRFKFNLPGFKLKSKLKP